MQVLRILVFPISLIYALVVHIRNFLFDTGVFKSEEFKIPTICVGNLSVGGTGKTPMIEYLIKTFKDTAKIGVVSRGYGRKSIGFQEANSDSTVEVLGDEPFQIYSKYPDISLAVDTDRRNGISTLERNNNLDVILLDDAFQHRKVKPTFSILLTSFDNLYTTDWYLPTGTLRDSKREAKRADLIIVTKCPEDLPIEKQLSIKSKLKPLAHQEVMFSYLKYNHQLQNLGTKLTLENLKNKKITLVTGIANPKPLLMYLAKFEIEIEHLNYKDHHFFTDIEIDNFNTKDFVLTTEKDFVRLNGKVNKLSYISIEHLFLNDGAEVLKERLNKIIIG